MIGSESNGFRKSVVFTKVRLSLVRLFEYGQFCGSAHVCGAGPLGDRSLPRRSSGYIYRGFPLIPPYRCTSEVRRFLRKRHVCGAGPLGDRSLPRRSLGYIYRGVPLIPPYRCTSEVRRFLRKRHVCGASSLGDRSLPRRSLGYTCRPLSTPSNGITKSASGGFPRGRAWINF